jgi:IS4 transposase
LKELALRAKWIDNNLKSDKRVVHIVDREADSVAFMRELSSNGNLFLLRVKDNSKLYYPEEEIDINQKSLAEKLPLGVKVKEIKYRNKKTSIYVNECDVEVRRDATTMILSSEGKRKLQKTKGDTLKVRFIVERLVDENNKVVAKWLLITNIVDKKVTTETLATWYYYRWKIESYFKLLKSSGFNLQEWQQVEPEALFKRLLVVSYSCILVWKIANDSSKNAQKIRKFLVTLSGKLMEWNKEFTYPALLSGLENYIQIMDVLLLFSREELFDMKKELDNLMGISL